MSMVAGTACNEGALAVSCRDRKYHFAQVDGEDIIPQAYIGYHTLPYYHSPRRELRLASKETHVLRLVMELTSPFIK